MAPVPLSRPAVGSIIPKDVLHSALSTLRTSSLLQPISSFIRRGNAQLSSPFKSAELLDPLISRQTISSDPAIIPTTYGQQNNSPSPGTVVGIVLGSVGGLLLLLWLLYTCCTFARPKARSTYTEDVTIREDVRRRSHNSHRSPRPHSRRVSTTEKVEVRRQRSQSPAPVRVVREEVRQETRRPPPPVERVIVEERREVRRNRQERSSSTSNGGSDEVVVIEEHDPPRRHKSKRDKRERERERDSGFRTVDPLSFGGIVGGEGKRGERRR